MNGKVIINARRQLDWKRRLFSDLVTASLWIGWILLWLPVYRRLHQAIGLHLDFDLAAEEVLQTIAPISYLHSIAALIGTCVLLLLWTLLPRRTATHAHASQTLEDYAEAFGLDAAQIERGRDSRIVVVHHDADGRIRAIQSAP